MKEQNSAIEVAVRCDGNGVWEGGHPFSIYNASSSAHQSQEHLNSAETWMIEMKTSQQIRTHMQYINWGLQTEWLLNLSLFLTSTLTWTQIHTRFLSLSHTNKLPLSHTYCIYTFHLSLLHIIAKYLPTKGFKLSLSLSNINTHTSL